jgi:hypothetical protein
VAVVGGDCGGVVIGGVLVDGVGDFVGVAFVDKILYNRLYNRQYQWKKNKFRNYRCLGCGRMRRVKIGYHFCACCERRNSESIVPGELKHFLMEA